MTTLTFLGAIDTVTGSRYLLQTAGRRILIDCGLYQGPKKLRERNWNPLPFDVTTLDAVILTHAHIDHSGYLPRLCKQGYSGPVYCTHGTRDLLQLLLPDAGHLQEEEAEHANRWGYARHSPALPLYTRQDADRCMEQLVPVPYHDALTVAPGVTATFRRAGHIIGAASVTITSDVTVTFSGDVGRACDPIMRAPEPLADCDYLVVESTYGDRRHPDRDLGDLVAGLINETLARSGVVVVPAFAVGRAQHLLHLLSKLRAENRIPPCPIFLDSPMAIDATGIFVRHAQDHVLSPEQCASMARITQYSQTAEDSKAIDRSGGPMIVISASGMCTGGRVLHHLLRFLPDDRSTILFVGFQGAGTRGRSLVDGATEIKLLGQYVPVRAKIANVEGLSAHADYAELVSWLRSAKQPPRSVFVTHGEPSAADALRRRVRDELGWSARVPELGETVKLT